MDPVTMYETVRNRIAALEEEEVHGEEEEKKIGTFRHSVSFILFNKCLVINVFDVICQLMKLGGL